MTTYEQDPDVLQWGLQLFDSDPYSSCGYYGTIMQGDMDHYHGHYFEGDNYDTECSNIENDELIAQALQEELSQLAVVEAPGSPDEELERLQLSVVSQDWLGQSLKNSGSGHECGQEEDDTMRPSTSCSSPDENSYCGDELSYSLELMDEYAFDGEVGKRLTLMVPVPHVPRINGEIPSVDEETLDHQRLLDRLQLYDLVEHKVQGDGNCQFRALSDQFYRTPEHHKFVREQVINQLKSYLEIYEGYVPMAYDDYLEKMSKSGEWGDHVTLQAAADSYGVKIFVITSFKDTCYIEILPNVERSKRVICLSFWAEVHYNSIYPEGDVPASMIKKKKRRWMLRNKHLESPDQG
ncbi:OVARIAN TUMOR DOMAIN-containing deubiquitinating enzyme 12-like isoform X1 [Carya illinoinensis]|uniref:ubiquitinyl hydrolase 1 n=1 Tax=Carya illinoinensis TaxID=32201 RepID=A0A8T1NSF1_CARIL|nr:OVARIAN TUMOR DOMAIN-containing deubiquitinating enzyme 12-like isoform X1 [Carya illinoinensis]XP_042955544.1 OVARIAN TUMOR DOMAIN-containing deubiquitinating enzyme 12-like isoform X1 [Carya illinoinensis]XP_042955545.1 OVARIAN TUMOR DOMAIN-containing deubiquitinating enzyme 12-like isoform X1 [Carya illinoinensis]XP_042955546.1 OVARIAN TUMOR DOMAIN-containing deubiquitinating enzyme 12-like isoform X1 [Carya illinoinensis]XP_042955547.1 OVARIAN TUMOR DOMAIN-containing deubiquitinating enz